MPCWRARTRPCGWFANQAASGATILGGERIIFAARRLVAAGGRTTRVVARMFAAKRMTRRRKNNLSFIVICFLHNILEVDGVFTRNRPFASFCMHVYPFVFWVGRRKQRDRTADRFRTQVRTCVRVSAMRRDPFAILCFLIQIQK